MDHLEIERYFSNIVDGDKNLSNGIAAIKTLLLVLEKTKCKMLLNNFTKTCFDYIIFLVNTIQGLVDTIKEAIKVLRNCGKPITAVCSSCELFICFITLASPKLEDKTMDEVKTIMLNRGHSFLKKLLDSRNVIAKYGVDFITDGCVSFTSFWYIASHSFLIILENPYTLSLTCRSGNGKISSITKQALSRVCNNELT